MRPPSPFAFYSFLFVLAGGAVAFLGVGYPNIASGIFAATLLPILWYRKRLRVFGRMAQQCEACVERLRQVAAEVSRVEEEARGIENDLRRLTGKTDITQEDIGGRAPELEERGKVGGIRGFSMPDRHRFFSPFGSWLLPPDWGGLLRP